MNQVILLYLDRLDGIGISGVYKKKKKAKTNFFRAAFGGTIKYQNWTLLFGILLHLNKNSH